MDLQPRLKRIAWNRRHLRQQIIRAQVVRQQSAESECANAIPCPVEEIPAGLEYGMKGRVSPHR
jgi:hypothetical protein